MCSKRFIDGDVSLSNPNSKHERQSSPLLPGIAEVVRMLIWPVACAFKQQSSIANYEPSIMFFRVETSDIADLRICRRKNRMSMPHVLEQKLQQCNARHGAATHEHFSPGELSCRPLREQHHASHRTVARNCEVGQKQIPP